MTSLHVVGTRSEIVAQVEVHVHVCMVVGGWATDSGLEKRIGSANRGAGVGIVVDDFATCSRHETRSRGAGRGAGVGIFLDAFTTDSRYDKRFGSAGRGTSPCLHSYGWAGYGM